MFKNYLLVALRSLFRHPIYSTINITGLTIGLACCLMILTFVRYELTFDTQFTDADRIYRAVGSVKTPDTGKWLHSSNIMLPVLPQLAVEYPQVESWTRVHPVTISVISGEKRFNEDIYLADPAFFEIFNFRFLDGNPETALSEPFSTVLTETMAKKYFGHTDVVGKVLSGENSYDLNITGVIEDTPQNVHFKLGIVSSIEAYRTILPQEMHNMMDNWGGLGMAYGYFKLAPGASITPINNDFNDFLIRNSGEVSTNFEQGLVKVTLQPLLDIHLNPKLTEPSFEKVSHYLVVYAGVVLAALVLLIAIFNFINLTTARASLRAKEIGLRKVLGASRGNLVLQFLSETLVITTLSTLLAVGLVELVKPWFGSLIYRDLAAVSLLDAGHWLYLLLLILATTLLAGAYPAFVLSRALPAQALKGAEQGGHKGRLRKALVIAQFAVSIVLVIATLAAQSQLHHLRNMDLGFNKESVVAMKGGTDSPTSIKPLKELKENYESIRTELLRHPEVLSVGFSTVGFPGGFAGKNGFGRPGADINDFTILGNNFVDPQFLETFDVRFVAGRNFSPDLASDKATSTADNAFIVTEGGSVILTLDGVKKLGWSSPEEALGQEVIDGSTASYRVIGVIENIYGLAGYINENPEVFIYNDGVFTTISVKLSGKRTAEALKHLEDTWNRMIPNNAVTISFVDDGFEQMHSIFNQVIKGFTMFSLLAILIACLGLYAMASFTAERRTKEIGVRKVMGASTFDITKLLLWDFSKPVFVALVVALPVAFLLTTGLKQAFVNHASMGAGMFAIAAIGTLLIAWLTVSIHTIRVASSNPTNALRYE